MCGETDNEIRFVNGDLLEIYFTIEDLEVAYIAKVYFSCVGAKVLCELPYSEEQESFCLRFPSKLSEEVKPGFYTYDLTLELSDGSNLTVLHNEDFVVLKKKNTLSEDAYIEDENGWGGDEEGNEPTESETPPEETEPSEPSEGDGDENPPTPPESGADIESSEPEGGNGNDGK